MYKVYYNGTLIHDPSLMSLDYILLNGKCSKEAGKVDSMDFTILPSHPYYSAFTKLQTGIVAYRDSVEIFRGRILSTSVNMNGEKNVQCEGSLAYLLDTVQPNTTVDGTITCANLLRTIIARHNEQVEEVKRFQIGIISALKANDEIEVNQSGFTETRQMIDSYLLNTKGGFLRARYENGVQYLDWIEDYGRNPNQPFLIGANIVSMTEENSADDFYTMLLPIGKEEATEKETREEIEEDEARDHTVFVSDVNGGSPYMPVSTEMVNTYGKIYHMEDYGTVESPSELKALANDTLDQFRKKLNRTVEITGLDLHFIDPLYDQILIGDRVHIIAPHFNKNEVLIATKIDYDFSKPQNDRFSFGDGLTTLTRKTESGISTTSKTATKAKNDSLTNGRDLFIKKNLIDIEANTMDIRVRDAMSITAKYVKWTFDAMAFGGKEYRYSPADAQRIRGELANRWIDITRNMSGYISPEQGLADFTAMSDIVTDAAEQVNNIYMHLDSDQGLFNWGVESKNMNALGNFKNSVELILNGPAGTGGLIAKVNELDETGQKTGELLRAAGIQVDANTGAWLFNTDYTTGLGSVIKTQTDKVSMVVGTDYNGNNVIKAGEIVLAINEQSGQSTARINADKVLISGGDVEQDLDTYLLVQKGKIDLVVGVDSQGHYVVNPASIVAAINDRGQSEVKINADQIDLSGFVRARDINLSGSVGAYSIGVADVSADRVFADSQLNAPGLVSSLQGTSFSLPMYISDDCYMGPSASTGNSLWNAVKTLQLVQSGNTYTLQKQSYNDSNWVDVGTFSRATTLSGAWGSGTFTVGASPQGNSRTTTLLSAIPNADVTWNGNTASFPIKAVLDDSEVVLNTGRTLSIDAQARYNAGYNSGESAGLAKARLSLNSANHTVNIGSTGDLVSATVRATGTIGAFDGAEMAYPITIKALVHRTEMYTDTIWVYCEPEGAYSDGYAAGYEAGFSAGSQAPTSNTLVLNPQTGVVSVGAGGSTTSAPVTVHAREVGWDSVGYKCTIRVWAEVGGTTMASSNFYVYNPNG